MKILKTESNVSQKPSIVSRRCRESAFASISNQNKSCIVPNRCSNIDSSRKLLNVLCSCRASLAPRRARFTSYIRARCTENSASLDPAAPVRTRKPERKTADTERSGVGAFDTLIRKEVRSCGSLHPDTSFTSCVLLPSAAFPRFFFIFFPRQFSTLAALFNVTRIFRHGVVAQVSLQHACYATSGQPNREDSTRRKASLRESLSMPIGY